MFMGTRPEIVKMAPIINSLYGIPEIDFSICDTSQHYDEDMSGIFYEELELPTPDYSLDVGSGSHGEQIAKTVMRAEKVIKEVKPDICMAEGDTNSVLGVAIASVKLAVPFAHVEAGLRSFDFTMPEEINRRLVDNISNINFAPSLRAALNLLYEGIPPSRIYISGNTIVDAIKKYYEESKRKSTIIEDLELDTSGFLVTFTLHRPENVDNPKRLKLLIESLKELRECQIVFPVHPRTKNRLEETGLLEKLIKGDEYSHVLLLKPLGYFDFLRLLGSSNLVMTDSGGVQEEAFTLGIRCLTLRQNTERPETVVLKANKVTGYDKERIVSLAKEALYSEEPLNLKFNPYGDGKAGQRIVDFLLENWMNLKYKPPKYLEEGSPSYKLVNIKQPVKISEIGMGEVTMVYDAIGNPILPEPDLTMDEGWKVRLLGERKQIDKFKDGYKNTKPVD